VPDSSRRSSAPRPAGRGRSRPRTSAAASPPRSRTRAGGAKPAEEPRGGPAGRLAGGPAGGPGGRLAGGLARAGRTSRRTKLTGRAAALALVACALVLALTYPLQEYIAQRAQIEDMRERTAEQRERVGKLQEQRARWNDPAFVKAQARDRLHFVMPGETGYVAVDPRAGGGSPAPSGTPSKAAR
jgi:cell division protein FtsB